VITKNNSYKSCRVQREATVDDIKLDLEVRRRIFKVILRLTSIFSMETRIFDPGFGKSTKLCIKNMYHVKA